MRQSVRPIKKQLLMIVVTAIFVTGLVIVLDGSLGGSATAFTGPAVLVSILADELLDVPQAILNFTYAVVSVGYFSLCFFGLVHFYPENPRWILAILVAMVVLTILAEKALDTYISF